MVYSSQKLNTGSRFRAQGHRPYKPDAMSALTRARQRNLFAQRRRSGQPFLPSSPDIILRLSNQGGSFSSPSPDDFLFRASRDSFAAPYSSGMLPGPNESFVIPQLVEDSNPLVSYYNF